MTSGIFMALMPVEKCTTNLPDLIITQIKVTDGGGGRHHYIRITLKNQGSIPTYYNFCTRCYFTIFDNSTGIGVKSTLFDYWYNLSIPAGSSADIPLLLPYDQYWINPDPSHVWRQYSAYADIFNNVPESNENNNNLSNPWMNP